MIYTTILILAQSRNHGSFFDIPDVHCLHTKQDFCPLQFLWPFRQLGKTPHVEFNNVIGCLNFIQFQVVSHQFKHCLDILECLFCCVFQGIHVSLNVRMFSTTLLLTDKTMPCIYRKFFGSTRAYTIHSFFCLLERSKQLTLLLSDC